MSSTYPFKDDTEANKPAPKICNICSVEIAPYMGKDLDGIAKQWKFNSSSCGAPNCQNKTLCEDCRTDGRDCESNIIVFVQCDDCTFHSHSVEVADGFDDNYDTLD